MNHLCPASVEGMWMHHSNQVVVGTKDSLIQLLRGEGLDLRAGSVP